MDDYLAPDASLIEAKDWLDAALEEGPHRCPCCTQMIDRNNPPSDFDQLEFGPFVRDSETSRQAALDNYPRQGTQRRKVLAALERQPSGMTREEIAVTLGLPDSSVRPRVVELIRGNWIQETPRTRRTSTGSKAAVLVAKDRDA